jgi:hypothetical protein
VRGSGSKRRSCASGRVACALRSARRRECCDVTERNRKARESHGMTPYRAEAHVQARPSTTTSLSLRQLHIQSSVSPPSEASAQSCRISNRRVSDKRASLGVGRMRARRALRADDDSRGRARAARVALLV